MKKWLIVSGSLLLHVSGLLHAQGQGKTHLPNEKVWRFGNTNNPGVDTTVISDSIIDRFWGNWYISAGPEGMGLLDNDRKEVLLPCFKTITYRSGDGELDLQLGKTRYTLFLLQVRSAGSRDSIRVTTRDAVCPVCKGHKYMMEEVAVMGTELRITEYRKEVTASNDRYKTIQVRISEKRKPARVGYQWQERKCKTCQGSGRGILQKILIKDRSGHSYQEV